ncbi:MAG: phosphoribosylanthranilate isomerase, partial [Bacteroidetes bacterium]
KDLFAVDVNSKFEIEPGIKNIELVSNFIKSVKQ